MYPLFSLGGVMAGFGGVTAIWEGYNLKKAIDQSEANESPIGRELRNLSREIARNIHTYLQNNGA